MTWETRLLDLFDDLEQQAEGLSLAARDLEVTEMGRDEYAQVDLASRLHASVGAEAVLWTAAGQVRGRLARVGSGWCLVRGDVHETVVSLPAVLGVRGLGSRSDPEQVRPVVARLGLGSALRAVARMGESVAVWDVAGTVRQGTLVRVGADFVELDAAASRDVIPFHALVLVRSR